MNMKKIKEPVRLREKKLSDGSTSLYLDIYHNGIRKYEFLKLYLRKETTRSDRDANRTTLAIANSIKSKRIIDIQSGAYNVKLAERNNVPLFPYIEKHRQQLESRQNTLWDTVCKMIADYAKKEDITFKHIDTAFCNGFRLYLDTKTNEHSDTSNNIKQGSKHVYFAVFKAILNQAVKDGIIDRSPAINIQGFKPSEAKRTYLTTDEVRKLASTECKRDCIKNAFLFSCLTGLRLSDIRALKWGDVTEENGFTRITFRQKKTKWQEYLDINKQAVSLMGERKKNDACVFDLVYSNDHINNIIADWVQKADIDKHITFHVARHTFATMMLNNGVDLYTVSKLVGHRDIKTTQIYAKVIDAEKQKAVEKIPKLL